MIKVAIKNAKTMVKQLKKFRHSTVFRRLSNVQMFVVVVCLLAGGVAWPVVYADQYTQQIQQLQVQNSQVQSSLNSLQLQAGSYQDAINQLQAQISAIQVSINANQIKQTELQQQIQQVNTQITQQKKVLGDDIKAMYISGQMTTIEELATSKSLSDFVNAQTYRNAVQTSIQDTLTQITELENQLKNQQAQTVSLIQTQQAQQGQLSADQSQQTQLLSYNQQQQTQYNQQINANSAQISRLEAEQAAANESVARTAHVVGASSGLHPDWFCADPGTYDEDTGDTGGYPEDWCNAQFTMESSPNDSNGFPERQCTSYAYWYFTSVEDQTDFNVVGNAGWWWETSNYPVTAWNSSVKVGALGVEPSSSLNAPVPSLHGSYYGHVMIVMALPGQTYGGQYVQSGYVLVASMNERETGQFEYDQWPVADLLFINPQ